MSLNKGKAKVKTKSKSKSTTKGVGKNKAAVMNSRNPKKPMAISGDTMSNYAMYKAGGTTKKKYAVGGDSGDSTSTTDTKYYKIKNRNREKNGITELRPEKQKEISEKRYNRIKDRLTNRAGTTGYTNTETDAWNGMNADTEVYFNKSGKKGIGSRSVTYKKGGTTKSKFAALAPPYNKATAADRIAGAKKNSRKK
jgi:hypothetical protein